MNSTVLPQPAPRKSRSISRRWCVPPAILLDPCETLEGSMIFDEFRRGGLGLLLWSTLRDITLWAAVTNSNRPGLFNPETAEKRVIAVMEECSLESAEQLLLARLATVTSVPDAAEREVVSLVCTEVSRWAEDAGAAATSIAFAQAASLIDESDAHASRRVGMLLYEWAVGSGSWLRRQRLARAETWMRRAIAQGRRAKAWDAYALAYVDLGQLYHAEKKIAARAKAYFTKAQHAARRHGQLAIRASAMHGLLRVAITQNECRTAEPLAKATLRAYRRTAQPVTALLQDIAQLWINIGNYRSAVAALRRIIPSQTDPQHRAVIAAMLAHAAAGAGELELYREWWSSSWLVLTQPGARARDGFERALLELSRAAVRANDPPRAFQATALLRQRIRNVALSCGRPWADEYDGNEPMRRADGGPR